MSNPRRRRPRAHRVALRVPLVARLLPVVLVVACASAVPPAAPPPPRPDAAPAPGPGGLVVVLPPADRLADAEREQVRRAVDRALTATLPVGIDIATVPVLEPADTTVMVDTVERAIRRVGPGGTVCVIGAGIRDAIAPLLALYPATRACLIPATAIDDAVRLAVDVDLEGLGRELGAAARSAAGAGTVLLVDGGDALLDRRWRIGVVAGILEPGGGLAPGSVITVRTADEALGLLDAQAALIAEGIVPGSPEAMGRPPGAGPLEILDGEVVPPERAFPPITVVVLDASIESALVVGPAAERGLLLVGPRSLLGPGGGAEDPAVLRWRVRWHIPLTALLRAAIADVPPVPTGDAVVALERGRAAVR